MSGGGQPEVVPAGALGTSAGRLEAFGDGVFAYPVATAVGLLSVPLFLAVLLALAAMYLLPTPDVGLTHPT